MEVGCIPGGQVPQQRESCCDRHSQSIGVVL